VQTLGERIVDEARMTEERRENRRRKTLKGGRIVFNGGWSTLSCTIRDISDRGAKLSVESALGVPAQFTLEFGDGGASRGCVVKWRNPSTLGVEFKTPGASSK
jgi:hypothetical protein